MCAFQSLTYTSHIGTRQPCLYAECVIRHRYSVKRVTRQACAQVCREVKRAVRGTGRWLRALSNVMLGMALGLLAYYSLTNALGWLAQRELHSEVADLGPLGVDVPDDMLRPPGRQLDFDGWEDEDLAYWQELPDGGVFGRLVMPAIGLDTAVVKGVRPADLRKGPGWIDWTDLPGSTGTCGISGHRTTYLAPFRRLDELAPGDTIDLFSPYRRYRYVVARMLVVTPDQTEVVAPTEQPTLTLTACHPPYSARYRLAVQADLIEVRRVAAQE
jgi:LPXTG-site transpeptidase (sortase) family protein